MSTATQTHIVWFTTKGRIAIPLWLRKKFQIEDGTRAVVEATPAGILLKTVKTVTIRRVRGILKRGGDRKSWNEEWNEHKNDERKLEETKHGITGTSKKRHRTRFSGA